MFSPEPRKSFNPQPKPEPRKKKEPKPLKRTAIKKEFKGRGYRKLYLEIWIERPHVSEISGKPIREYDVCCFMHLLSKGAYPEFKLDKRNVFLVTREEHHRYDNVEREPLKDLPEWQKVFELREELKFESANRNK